LRLASACPALEDLHGFAPGAPNIPAIVRNDEADEPIEQRRAEHQRDEARLSPSVKCIAEDDQNKVAPTLRRSKKGVISQQGERQEIIYEQMRAKDHGS
jgi:hypothetical protein